MLGWDHFDNPEADALSIMPLAHSSFPVEAIEVGRVLWHFTGEEYNVESLKDLKMCSS